MDKQDAFGLTEKQVFELATQIVFKAAEGGLYVRYRQVVEDILNAVDYLAPLREQMSEPEPERS